MGIGSIEQAMQEASDKHCAQPVGLPGRVRVAYVATPAVPAD